MLGAGQPQLDAPLRKALLPHRGPSRGRGVPRRARWPRPAVRPSRAGSARTASCCCRMSRVRRTSSSPSLVRPMPRPCRVTRWRPSSRSSPRTYLVTADRDRCSASPARRTPEKPRRPRSCAAPRCRSRCWRSWSCSARSARCRCTRRVSSRPVREPPRPCSRSSPSWPARSPGSPSARRSRPWRWVGSRWARPARCRLGRAVSRGELLRNRSPGERPRPQRVPRGKDLTTVARALPTRPRPGTGRAHAPGRTPSGRGQ